MSQNKHQDSNQMTGAAMIVRALVDHGVEHIFGYPGGAVLPIYDEIFQQSDIEHVLVRHEQGAGHAAEGYARSTGKPGVALVTSGPGATNMVTPLADALVNVRNTLVDGGGCVGTIVDGDGNLEFPGTSCGFDTPSADPGLEPGPSGHRLADRLGGGPGAAQGLR